MLGRIGTYGVYVSVSIFWAAGCSAVLGIEELGSEPRLSEAGGSGNGGDGNGGSSGDASVGGTSSGGRVSGTGNAAGRGGAATGGRNSGGAGGLQPDGSAGSSGAGGGGGAGGLGVGGAGGVTSGGAGGRAAGGAGGQNTGGAQGGAGGATGSTVNGKVIDFWGHPVPNVIVTAGTHQTDTGPAGTFTAPNVSGTYDVSLVVSYGSTTEGWVFQGLTRRDPTLQLDQAFDYHQADTYATSTGVALPAMGQMVGYAFGSPESAFAGVIDESPENLWYVYYYGPATTTGGAHALRWTHDAQNLPVLYKAYDTVQVTMVDSPTPVNFNLALGDDANLMTASISGTVTSGSSNRANRVYARFTDGAALEVVTDDAPPAAGNYSYKVPVALPNAGITMAAVDGDLGYVPIGIAYREDVAANATGVNLTIPSPRALLAPVDSAPAGNATSFRWSAATGVSVFTVLIDPYNTSNKMHIVTATNTVTLPTFPDASYAIPAGAECYWFVETHGSATVDAAAGPTGFLDPFVHHALEGRRKGGGSYTESLHRMFNYTP